MSGPGALLYDSSAPSSFVSQLILHTLAEQLLENVPITSHSFSSLLVVSLSIVFMRTYGFHTRRMKPWWTTLSSAKIAKRLPSKFLRKVALWESEWGGTGSEAPKAPPRGARGQRAPICPT